MILRFLSTSVSSDIVGFGNKSASLEKSELTFQDEAVFVSSVFAIPALYAYLVFSGGSKGNELRL